MRGVVTQNGKLELRDIDEPIPAAGQVLVRTLTCGICGTDLHARDHMHEFLTGLQRSGNPLPTQPEQGVVFGHEFCVETLDHGPVIGVDFSPGRRRFAEAVGADEVVDAAQESQASVWSRHGAGRKGRRAVVFECVGRPHIAQKIIDEVPRNALVVVVGNVLGDSSIDQVVAFNKELDICFTMNYSPAEFKQTLHDLAEGRIEAESIVTGIVGPEGVAQAFTDLADAERHAKIIVKFE